MNINHKIKKLSIKVKINSIFFVSIAFISVAMYWIYRQQAAQSLTDAHQLAMSSLNDLTETLSIVETLTDSGFTQSDYNLIRPYLTERRYFETGYAFLVNKQGTFLLHPWKEGTNEVRTNEHIKRLYFDEESGYFRHTFSDDGLAKWQYVKYFSPYNAYLAITINEAEIVKGNLKLKIAIILFILVGISIILVGRRFVTNPIIKAVIDVKAIIGDVAKGKVTKKIENRRLDEIGEMINSIEQLITELEKKTYFSDEIAKGNLNAELLLQSDEDMLGKSLINMRNEIAASKQTEHEQQIKIEHQNHINKGLSEFAEIMRQNINSIDELSYNIISNLVKYTGVNMGGIFVIDDNEEDPLIEMTACYAYDRKRLEKRNLHIGEGLVGECIAEKENIHIKKLPTQYINIASGLGESNPKELLITPLKTDNEVVGAIELASLNEIEPHIVLLVEKVSESLASTIIKMKSTLKTEKLLEQTNQQARQMKIQEEELRQNMEEIQATQEQMELKEKMLLEEMEHLKAENAKLIEKIKLLKQPRETPVEGK